MDNELMKKAIMKKKMNGLDLTIILGGQAPESDESELAPGAPDSEKQESIPEEMAEGGPEEMAEDKMDPEMHEKMKKMLMDSGRSGIH